jgi:hypothetical protein
MARGVDDVISDALGAPTPGAATRRSAGCTPGYTATGIDLQSFCDVAVTIRRSRVKVYWTLVLGRSQASASVCPPEQPPSRPLDVVEDLVLADTAQEPGRTGGGHLAATLTDRQGYVGRFSRLGERQLSEAGLEGPRSRDPKGRCAATSIYVAALHGPEHPLDAGRRARADRGEGRRRGERTPASGPA